MPCACPTEDLRCWPSSRSIGPMNGAKMSRTSAPLSEISFVSSGSTQELTTRSEEHTSELQSLMRISYAVFCLKKKNHTTTTHCKTNIHSSYSLTTTIYH